MRHVISVVLAAGCIVCLTRAFFYSNRTKEQKEISILQLENSLDEKAASSYLEDMSVAFWGEQQGIEVQNRDLSRSTKAAAITVCGDSGLVLESSRGLDSSMSGYCLIDKQTSWELFGSTSPVGQQVEINKTAYQVAGILTSAVHTVLIQAEPQKEASMDKMSLRIPVTENRQEYIRLFASQTGIAGKEIPVHYYGNWAYLIVYMLPVFLFGAVLYELIKDMHFHKSRPVLRALLLLLFLGMAAVYVWILDINGEFPVEFLPTKWSDFNFWSNLWKQKIQDTEFLMQIEKSQPQLILFYLFLKSAGYSLLAVLLARLSLPEVEKIKGRGRMALILSSLLITFLSVAGASKGNEAAAGNRMIWLFLPAYLAGKYAVGVIKDRMGNR